MTARAAYDAAVAGALCDDGTKRALVAAGTAFPSGLTLREHVPQGHKVALVDLPADSAVLRYNVAIGSAVSCARSSGEATT